MTRRVEGESGGGYPKQFVKKTGKTGSFTAKDQTGNVAEKSFQVPKQNLYESGSTHGVNAKAVSSSGGLWGIIQKIKNFISRIFSKSVPKPELSKSEKLKKEMAQISKKVNAQYDKEIGASLQPISLKEKMVALENRGVLSEELITMKEIFTDKCTQILLDAMAKKEKYDLNMVMNSLDPEIRAFIDMSRI